jgi:DNA replication protein DnaC
MSEESHKTIWLSGSESYPAQATQCQAVLDAIGVRVASGHVLKPGEHAAEQTAAEIESAAGIIILLGPKWTTQTDPKEVACIEAQCSQKASLWIINIDATVDPPVLQKLLTPARGTQRLPRSGNTLTRLSVQKRRVVLEELARSVAAQLELPLPRDAQYRQLQDYRRTRYEQLEFVPLRGFFGAQHVDAARAFRFTELFVSPRLEWLRQPASIAEQYRRLSAQIEDQRLSAQERWDLEMQRSALASRYGQGAVAKLEEILHRHPQIILLGKPGSGKSSILHYLEMHAHQRNADLAVQIKLQSIAEKAGHGESLWPQVLQKIRSEHGSVVAEAFEEWADQGRALLLLDGVDEVQAEHRAKLLSAVEKMLLGTPEAALRRHLTPGE